MRHSRRANRMARHHRRLKRRYAFNLVSLMDIFTILVFFLLVNSSDVQTLPNPQNLQLPESSAQQQAKENVVVMLTRNQILVQGEPVMRIDAAQASKASTLPELAQALARHTPKRLLQAANDNIPDKGPGEVTVMADKALPYRLLRKVMLTCTQSAFRRISLAVLKQGQSTGQGGAG